MPPPRQIIMIDQSEIVRSLLYHIPAKNQPFTSIPGQGWYELFLKRLDTSSTNWYYVQKLVPAQLWLQPNLLHHDSSSCTKCCSTTRWLLGLSINILGQTLTPTKKKKKVASYFLQMVMMMVFLQTWFLERESGLGWSSIYTHPFTFLSNASFMDIFNLGKFVKFSQKEGDLD